MAIINPASAACSASTGSGGVKCRRDEGRAGQGRAGQGRAGQGRAIIQWSGSLISHK